MLDKVAFDSLSIEPAGRTGDRLQFSVPYLKALAIYLCSRLVVFLGVVFGNAYIALGNDTGFCDGIRSGTRSSPPKVTSMTATPASGRQWCSIRSTQLSAAWSAKSSGSI
jgi:hypothetical protein